MWQKIEMGMNKKAFHLFGFIRTRVRAGLAFVLITLFAGSSVAFAYADTAQPGDILFPLGVAREKVEIFLAPSAKKNDLRVKFAEKRIEDGQVFLSLLVKAKGTYAVSYASSTATSTLSIGGTATNTATTTANNTTADAARHFDATIAYLQGLQAELLKNSDTQASLALQSAIDAMIAQAHQASPTSGGDSVLVKIKDNVNKFKMDVRIADGATTTRITLGEKNKDRGRDKNGDDNNHNQISGGATTTPQSGSSVSSFVGDNFITRFLHRGDKKRDEERGEQEKDDQKGRDGDEKENDDGHGNPISVSDTVVPNISDVSASAITASNATISWSTNESATGKIRYGTTTALTNVFENAALSLGHSFNITGLSASSTYHYIVSSTDSAGNTASSAELTFTTN